MLRRCASSCNSLSCYKLFGVGIAGLFNIIMSLCYEVTKF